MKTKICLTMVAVALLLAAPVGARGMDGTLNWGFSLGPATTTGDLSDVVDVGFAAEGTFGIHFTAGLGLRISSGYGTYSGEEMDVDYDLYTYHFMGELIYDISQNTGHVHPYLSAGVGFASAQLDSEIVVWDPYVGNIRYTYSDDTVNLLTSVGGGINFGPFGRNLLLTTSLSYRHMVGDLSVDYVDYGYWAEDLSGGFIVGTFGLSWMV